MVGHKPVTAMDAVAYNMAMQSFKAAVERAQAHCKLAHAIGARWPLDNARIELDDATFYLALAKAEVKRI